MAPGLRAAPAILAAGLCLAGCGVDEDVRPHYPDSGRVGASIAVLASTREVAVVDPDQGSVSLLDPATLELVATIPVGGEPRALLELASGALLVTTYRGGELVSLDPKSRSVSAHRTLCAGPFGMSESPAGDYVVVACEWEGAVLRLDPATLEARPIASDLCRPRAVAVVGDDVYVADFTGGVVRRIDASGAVVAAPLTPSVAPYRPALASMTANLATAVLPAFGRLYVAHELVNHSGELALEKVDDDYGSVSDGNPKLNPAVSALALGADRAVGADDPPVLYARFDGGSRVFNGPSALAALEPGRVLVAHVSTADVAILDATATDSDRRVLGSFHVGAGPAGVAVDAALGVAYVDNAFDGSVSRLDLSLPFDVSAPRREAGLTRVRAQSPRYSPAALAGRRLFHDASNPHLTPSAVVACSSCHPGGGDDGLVWFVHTSTIPLKRRRTPHLANAHTGTAPFHWSGEFPTIPSLVVGTLQNLMAGDALLVDPELVRAYIDEIVAPPLPPAGDVAGIARGRAVFQSAKAACATCHAGDALTDNQLHAVLHPMSLAADDVLPASNTPGLRGLFLRAPYFHDGRSPDLRDALTRADAAAHGAVGKLSAGELEDLLAYLKSL